MLRYVFQRIAAALVTFLVIICVVFFVVKAMPGSIFQPNPRQINPRAIELINAKYHLDKSLPEQFLIFISNYIRFDFGASLVVRPGLPVLEVIMERLKVTIQLNLFSGFFVLPMGMIFGITMALRKDTLYDHAASTAVVFFISVPSFVLAALLQYFVAFKGGLFPVILSPEETLTWTKFYSMILPILALSFGGIAGMARMLRAELAETLTSDFMLLAKAKGLTYGQTIWRHALRNACVPLATTFLYLFLGILGSSIVIENIFSVPGLSRTMIYAIQSNDHPLTMAIVYFYALIGLFMAILADLSYGVVDPRIRMGGRKNEE